MGSSAKVGFGHSLVAMGTQAASADPPAEQVAAVAAADSEVALLARRTLIDGVVRLGPPHGCGRVDEGGMTRSVAGLAAGIGVEASAARGGKG